MILTSYDNVHEHNNLINQYFISNEQEAYEEKLTWNLIKNIEYIVAYHLWEIMLTLFKILYIMLISNSPE